MDGYIVLSHLIHRKICWLTNVNATQIAIAETFLPGFPHKTFLLKNHIHEIYIKADVMMQVCLSGYFFLWLFIVLNIYIWTLLYSQGILQNLS